MGIWLGATEGAGWIWNVDPFKTHLCSYYWPHGKKHLCNATCKVQSAYVNVKTVGFDYYYYYYYYYCYDHYYYYYHDYYDY